MKESLSNYPGKWKITAVQNVVLWYYLIRTVDVIASRMSYLLENMRFLHGKIKPAKAATATQLAVLASASTPINVLFEKLLYPFTHPLIQELIIIMGFKHPEAVAWVSSTPFNPMLFPTIALSIWQALQEFEKTGQQQGLALDTTVMKPMYDFLLENLEDFSIKKLAASQKLQEDMYTATILVLEGAPNVRSGRKSFIWDNDDMDSSTDESFPV
ncbi:hypothetical protein K439DRAFT_1610241 [Ramaria rubella]|nr:hypothetical protein K439DRAFT_1610241 [Ramaria rubella]